MRKRMSHQEAALNQEDVKYKQEAVLIGLSSQRGRLQPN